MIERKEYLERLAGFKDKHIIKIVTGMRRCGKSTLLELFQQYLLKTGVSSEQILSINFEDYENRHLRNVDAMHTYVTERMVTGKKTYIFLDEIQMVLGFQEAVDSLHLRRNLDLYLTGSNALLLSGELATLLSGRYVEIAMLPLSFREYASAVAGVNPEEKYKAYLQNSSFPGALEYTGAQKHILDYLRGIYDSAVLKDVVGRYRISDVMMLESIIRFTFDNVGNQLSTKSISDAMNSDGRKIDIKTVERYLRALMDSYILYQAKRYDIKGRQHLKTLEKYYAVDLGLRYMLLGKSGSDVGRLLENVVYLELLRRDYEVYVGKVDALEVDFVAVNQDGNTYFQVAATVREPSTLERELASLRKIPDHYPKFILTLDVDPDTDYDGIRRTNALQWLLQ
jgi:predicted AAA+ superfamily ATPase